MRIINATLTSLINKAKLQTHRLYFHTDLEMWPLHFLGSKHTHAFVEFSTADEVLFAELRKSTSGKGSGLQASKATLSINGAVCVGAFLRTVRLNQRRKHFVIIRAFNLKRNGLEPHAIAIF